MFKIFEKGFPRYLTTEEGLAVVNEEVWNVLDIKTLRAYAGRVLAISKALNNSFKDTYDYLLNYFDTNIAWRLTLRAKRGLADTEESGAYTKDLVYLKGYFLVKDYLKKKGSIIDLYFGKVGVDDIKLLKEIKGLKKPLYLPLFKKKQLDSFLNVV